MTNATLQLVLTGNGEPDLCADERGRLCWPDGSPVNLSNKHDGSGADCGPADEDADGAAQVLRDIAARNGLSIIDD